MPQLNSRPSRSDGLHTRNRLLAVALRLFAEGGFAATSTRAIAVAADGNAASIRYHFHDKAGLCRAALVELAHWTDNDLALFADPEVKLGYSLHQFYSRLFGGCADSDQARCWIRLWMREMLEPTGLRDDVIQARIAPLFDALIGRLAKDLAPGASVHDLSRLAFTLLGLPMQTILPFVARSQSPRMEANAATISGYVDAIILSEKKRCNGTIKGSTTLL